MFLELALRAASKPCSMPRELLTPPYAAIVVCHPHPLYGGTLHNKVVFHAMKALNSFGFPVLRFNFRGDWPESRRRHDHGNGELDVMFEPRWIGLTTSFTCPSSLPDFHLARLSVCGLPVPMRG